MSYGGNVAWFQQISVDRMLYDFFNCSRVGSNHRQTAQRPTGNVSDTKWNYSLKNRGYDYTKK